MALVIFFVSDPAKGAAEMARVVRPGGCGGYAWDILGGGFPFEPIEETQRRRHSAVASRRLEPLRLMWKEEKLNHTIFKHQDRPPLDAMPVEERDKLKARVRDRMPAEFPRARHMERPRQRGQGARGSLAIQSGRLPPPLPRVLATRAGPSPFEARAHMRKLR